MATTLNGTVLVDPYEISIDSSILGATKRSANGTILTDYITTITQKKLALSWRMLTGTERNTIVSACELAIGTPRTLVLPDSRSISVVMSAEASLIETEVRTATGWFYNLQVNLMENLRLT